MVERMDVAGAVQERRESFRQVAQADTKPVQAPAKTGKQEVATMGEAAARLANLLEKIAERNRQTAAEKMRQAFGDVDEEDD